MSWELFKVAGGLDLLGKEWVKIYSNFVWETKGDQDKILVVDETFKAHCPLFDVKTFYSSCY